MTSRALLFFSAFRRRPSSRHPTVRCTGRTFWHAAAVDGYCHAATFHEAGSVRKEQFTNNEKSMPATISDSSAFNGPEPSPCRKIATPPVTRAARTSTVKTAPTSQPAVGGRSRATLQYSGYNTTGMASHMAHRPILVVGRVLTPLLSWFSGTNSLPFNELQRTLQEFASGACLVGPDGGGS